MPQLVVIGGGNMGAALVGGMLAAGRSAESLAIVEVSAERRVELTARFPGVAVQAEVPSCDSAVVAVKPPDVARACHAAVEAGATRLLSIAAGVTLARLQEAVGEGVAVVRAMPNTPALVGKGAAAIAPGRFATPADMSWAESVLASVGTVTVLAEAALDAVTGLAGSGPAYLFLVAEALVDAGVGAGLDGSTSEALVRQLFAGVAAMVAQPDADLATMRAQVTSPGGTTAAGLQVLEERSLRATFADAVAAATQRSVELGQISST